MGTHVCDILSVFHNGRLKNPPRKKLKLIPNSKVIIDASQPEHIKPISFLTVKLTSSFAHSHISSVTINNRFNHFLF